jgi:hypothetical protein
MADQAANLAEREARAAHLLERLNEQAAERQRLDQLKPPRGRHKAQRDAKRQANQDALIELLEEVVTNPVLAHTLDAAGVAPARLHDAAERGARESEVLPAIAKAREPLPQPQQDGSNRIMAADAQAMPGAARQVEELADTPDASRAKQPDEPRAVWERLRGFVDRRPSPAAPEPTNPADDLPEAFRKRYAVHVSDDRKTIQLFEKGAKVASITLDAKAIVTPHDSGAVIGDVIALARDRGWQALKVRGIAEFKDAIWFEASKLGLFVEHDPSASVRASFEKWDRERPANQVEQGQLPKGDGLAPPQAMDLATAFMTKSPEQRLADPRLRNAQLELMIGIRTAEKELRRPIAEMPEVAQALTAAIREQLVQGRAFEAFCQT